MWTWPKLIIFDMDDSNPHYLSESEFTSDPPYNYYTDGIIENDTDAYDTVALSGYGCTVHNHTHILHFNWISYSDEYRAPTAYSYHPETDEWTLLTGNTNGGDKFNFGCSSDASGRYIYLLGGTVTLFWLSMSEPSFPTDKYDTYTDTWQRLPSTADYPEAYGREYALCILDRTTNSVLVTAGSIYISDCSERCWVSVNKLEIFRLSTEDWYIPQDETDAIYLPGSITATTTVTIDNFVPKGQNSNASADMIFFLGGGYGSSYSNSISFITVLTGLGNYPNNAVIIEGQHPTNEEIETTAFDPWQRFEFAFRIVITDDIDYEIDFESWNVSFMIDGMSFDALNEAYNTQIMTRDACQCKGQECENMPSNVKQVSIVEFMIPSHRALHNGYCVDHASPWIFNHNKSSIITVTATNGRYTHSTDFVFNFTKIELITAHQANITGVIRGCEIVNESNGILDGFHIQCDGYTCEQCPIFKGIGRDDKKGRMQDYLRNEIEYNILMNDVLLAPGQWIRQDHTEYTVRGTESLYVNSLIAVIRVRTAAGTWYQQCEYDFFFEFQEEWKSLVQILNDTTNKDLWNDVIDKLNSYHNEDVIAAYNVLTEMILDDEAPLDEDPVQEISNAIANIMQRMDDNKTISIDDITGDVALIDLLSSNPGIVDADIVLNITNEWLPQILQMTLTLLADQETEYEAGVLADTVQTIGAISNNVATNLLNVSNLTESERQQLIEDVQVIMSTGLEGSWEGEAIIHTHHASRTKGITINLADTTQCEFEDNTVDIPSMATHSDTVKCVMTVTDEAEVAIDLFSSIGTKVFATNDTCFPYFISMNVPLDSQYGSAFERALDGDWYNTSIDYPSCTFWNISSEIWDTRGCWVYAFDNDSVTCACDHLTTFKMSAEDFDPKAELLQPSDVRELNSENIQQHPTTWVTMLLIVIVLLVTCICVPNTHADKPMIAFEDIIYKEFRDQYLHKHLEWHEIQQIGRWYTKVVAQNNKTRSRKSKYYCLLSVNLFKIYLKNHHTVLSVFQRTDGTNFSTKQRIALFLLYMYMIMMADAVFYGGQDERRPIGDLTASALISLIATFPVYLMRILFQWSKPTVVRSTYKRNDISSQSNPPALVMVRSISLSEPELPEMKSHETTKDATDYWNAIKELKSRSRPDMKLVRTCMNYVDTSALSMEKAQLSAEIRLILFNYNYPFPHCVKKLAWFILIFASILCIITSVIYGIRFDVKSQQMSAHNLNLITVENEMENITQINGNTFCNLSHQLYAQSEVLSQQISLIRQEQDRIDAADVSYPDDFSFGQEGDIYDSTKWLLNVLISFLTSVFLWQPISIYLLTCIKMWAFHHGLIMETSLYNVFMLIFGCCIRKHNKLMNILPLDGSGTVTTTNADIADIVTPQSPQDQNNPNIAELSLTELSVSVSSGFNELSIVNDARSLDVIGFLSNDDLFID